MKRLSNILLKILPIIISFIAVYKSNKSSKIEERIKKLELYINESKVKEIEKHQIIENEPKIVIKDYKKFSGYYKMKIYNAGGLKAKNIYVNIPEEYHIIINNELPYKYLNPGCEFEVKLIYSSISISTFEITISCEDENGKIFNFSEIKQI